MSAKRIATRYAKSLLQLAIERDELEQVVADLQVVKQSLSARELYLLIKSPIIKGSKKKAIFKRLFEDQLSSTTNSFFDIMIRKGREDILPEIVESFQTQYNNYKQISRVVLRTAQPLDDEAIELIKQKLSETAETKSNIDLVVEVDPALIGGFTLQFEDKQYDSSIAYQLEKLRKQFS